MKFSLITNVKVKLNVFLLVFFIFTHFCTCQSQLEENSKGCKLEFEGFGIFLGSPTHFHLSPPGTIEKVIERVYNDLAIRYYRTSYESTFSQSRDNYSIECISNYTCTWIKLQEEISKYPNISVFASIWSPPEYMKNLAFDTLEEEFELPFYYFIRNITQMIKTRFNITIEKVSPVNEPENLFAPWEHTNMGPHQMCRMINSFNDSSITLCPENSYFWMSELYMNYTDNSTGVDCQSTCEIYATHAYTLNIDYFSRDYLLAYYDSGRYTRTTDKPIWQTEVCSTFGESDQNQMQEAFDLARNIINFLGTTCVQRYYYWNMYTKWQSGESIIWGYDKVKGELVLPKKYFVFRHFTLASAGGPKTIYQCVLHNVNVSSDSESGDNQLCLRVGSEEIVLMNKDNNHYLLEGFQCKSPLCCTTNEFDWFCINELTDVILPKMSVCSCKINSTSIEKPLVVSFNATIFTNEVH